MKKKIYIKPTMQRIEMLQSNILCSSLTDADKFHKVDTDDLEEGDVSNKPFDNSWDVL